MITVHQNQDWNFISMVIHQPSIRICEDFEKANANDELIVPVEVWVQDLEEKRLLLQQVLLVQDNQNVCRMEAQTSQELREHCWLKKEIKLLNLKRCWWWTAIIWSQDVTGMTVCLHSWILIYVTGLYSSAYENDNPMNGVSTIDIVKFKTHIRYRNNSNTI